MSHAWKTTTLTSEKQALDVFMELSGKRWLCRGQSERYGNLAPSIDRKPRQGLSRSKKLRLERQSIDLFRSTARFFADPGEQTVVASDLGALMVLQHYGVPTRLLDWSLSPWVAAFFATEGSDKDKGEIWAFDYSVYEREGFEQWKRWPETTRTVNPSRLIRTSQHFG